MLAYPAKHLGLIAMDLPSNFFNEIHAFTFASEILNEQSIDCMVYFTKFITNCIGENSPNCLCGALHHQLVHCEWTQVASAV